MNNLSLKYEMLELIETLELKEGDYLNLVNLLAKIKEEGLNVSFEFPIEEWIHNTDTNTHVVNPITGRLVSRRSRLGVQILRNRFV